MSCILGQLQQRNHTTIKFGNWKLPEQPHLALFNIQVEERHMALFASSTRQSSSPGPPLVAASDDLRHI